MGSPAAPLAARRRAASYCLLFAWLGLIFSVVLVAHHAFGWGPSWCELHARVSCDTVLNSPYARFLGVPVSLLGVSYFIIAVGFTVFLAGPRTDDEEIAAAFFLYTLLGCLGCAYFVWAEWTLGALCPLCTVVHVACFATLPLAWRIARTSAPRFSYGPVSVIKLALALPMWVLVAVLLFGTPLLAFYLFSLEELSYDPAGLEQLARCLTARNFKLYTLESCMYCKRQVAVFGSAASRLLETAMCTPESCPSDVTTFPTWVRRAVSANSEDLFLYGVQSLEALSLASGCAMPLSLE